ncbi:NifU family protein [Desulfonauticus submarinus]|uniref:Fe-S cluster biogenesis protein NfuA, 4Fe-4S-binding domain n=1 Tax=Desulfonauticus submarinus TaxID=206665 RepID=A0A1H0GMF9_9BACT|nr:NifU family protein [Desulfonauticus submarinus]SDO08078.1 Fe-S cluster biogenesis protein NfuA, 4Fe-4S-binding domain [Desulfonauticus submarinus]
MLKNKVEEVLDKVRPMLQADGGDVELVEVTDNGIVKVKLQGACHGCPMAQMTLKNGIERLLLKEIPSLKGVEAVQD